MIRFPCLILKGEIFVVPIWGGKKYGFSARGNFQSRRFEKEWTKPEGNNSCVYFGALASDFHKNLRFHLRQDCGNMVK